MLLEHLGWSKLLERWNHEAITHASELQLKLTSGMRETGWIGNRPAPPEQIHSTEATRAPRR